MEQKNMEKIEVLVKRWGIPLQLIMTMEECAELSVVCSKLLRTEVKREKLVDALADMYVMLQTVAGIYGVTGEELEAVAGNKLDIGLAKPYPEEPNAEKNASQEPAKEETAGE